MKILILTTLLSFNIYGSDIIIEKYSNDVVSEEETSAFIRLIKDSPSVTDLIVTRNQFEDIRFIESHGQLIDLDSLKEKHGIKESLLQAGAATISGDSGSGGGGG